MFYFNLNNKTSINLTLRPLGPGHPWKPWVPFTPECPRSPCNCTNGQMTAGHLSELMCSMFITHAGNFPLVVESGVVRFLLKVINNSLKSATYSFPLQQHVISIVYPKKYPEQRPGATTDWSILSVPQTVSTKASVECREINKLDFLEEVQRATSFLVWS